MASVRLSQALKDSIIGNIKKSFDKPIKDARERLASDFSDRVYKFLYRHELKHMQELPEDFFEQVTNLRVDLKNYDGQSIDKTLEFITRKPKAYKHDSWRSRPIIQNAALYNEQKIVDDAVKLIRDERDSLVKTVKLSFNRISTLKRLLEMMPELEMFIPQPALTTHYAKSEPRKHTKVEDISMTDEQRVAIAKIKMANL